MPRKVKGEAPDWAWNARIVVFHNERDLDAALALPRKEYRLRARRYAERGVTLVNATNGFHFRLDWVDRYADIVELTRRVTDACHEQGMKVYEHHSSNLFKKGVVSLGWNPAEAVIVDIRSGQPAAAAYGGRVQHACINNPGYKAHFKRYFLDFIEQTGVDGLMHDDIHYPGQYYCGCRYCRARFRSLFGYDLPAVGKLRLDDCDDPAWRDWLRLRLLSSAAQIEEVKAFLPKGFLLFSCMSVGVLSEADVHHAGASMESFARGTNCVFSEGGNLQLRNRAAMRPRHFFGNWEKLYAEKKYIKGISSGFDQPAFDLHYPADPKEGFFCWALTKIFGNCLWRDDSNIYGGTQYTDEFHEWAPEYDYFNWERAHESLFGRSKTLDEIGVVFSQNTKLALGVNPGRHAACFAGWIQALGRSGHAADCLTDHDLESGEKLGALKLLVLPNVAALSARAAGAVREYVNGGGRLIATHLSSVLDETGRPTGNFQLADLFGARLSSQAPDQAYWFLDNRYTGEPVFSDLFPVFSAFPAVRVEWEGEGEGRRVLAWNERTTRYHDEPQTPAMLRVASGRGETVYLAARAGFHAYREGIYGIWNYSYHEQVRQRGKDEQGRFIDRWTFPANRNPGKFFVLDEGQENYRLLIRNLVECLLPRPAVRVQAPAGVVFNLFVREASRRREWVLGLLNVGGAGYAPGTEVPPPARLHYPALEAPVCVSLEAGPAGGEARFYSPDLERPVTLRARETGGRAVFEIPPPLLRRVGFLVLAAPSAGAKKKTGAGK